MEWQPIETAPQFRGIRLLGRRPSGRVCTITPHYSAILGPRRPGGGHETIGAKFSGFSEEQSDALIPKMFTHWMYMPTPPNKVPG